MTIDHMGWYEAQLSRLDAKLKPLGERPVTSIREHESRPHPLDELGVRAEAMRLMAEVAEIYASTPESRDRVREVFERCRFVRWALWPSQEPTTPELFRLWLLGFSMRDVYDPRDEPRMVMGVCKVAVSAGVDVGPMLEWVAAISSDKKRYDYKIFPSMREVMLAAKGHACLPSPDAPPPSPAEGKQNWDLTFYDRLGLERGDQPCRREGCPRGAVDQSVYCRVHHFEMVMGKPCPFSH